MPLTAEQLQALIILEVGDDAAGTLAAQIALLWTAHDDQPSLDRQALYTKRHAIDVMLGRVRAQVDFRALDGASVNLSDLFARLTKMREQTTAEILAIEAGQSAGPASGELTTTAPVMPDGEWPDPNSRRLRGDPLLPLPGSFTP